MPGCVLWPPRDSSRGMLQVQTEAERSQGWPDGSDMVVTDSIISLGTGGGSCRNHKNVCKLPLCGSTGNEGRGCVSWWLRVPGVAFILWNRGLMRGLEPS